MDRKPDFCKVTEALDIVVGKWKPIILLNLLYNGTMRFSELKRQVTGITQKMLTAQLRGLENEDLIKRVVYAQVPPKVEYSITEHGRTLQPILEGMHEWGTIHLRHMKEINSRQDEGTK